MRLHFKELLKCAEADLQVELKTNILFLFLTSDTIKENALVYMKSFSSAQIKPRHTFHYIKKRLAGARRRAGTHTRTSHRYFAPLAALPDSRSGCPPCRPGGGVDKCLLPVSKPFPLS